MAKRLIALVLVAMALAGCETFRDSVARGGSFCDIAEPHYHTARAQAAMTNEELGRETRHNEKGEKICGWKAPR